MLLRYVISNDSLLSLNIRRLTSTSTFIILAGLSATPEVFAATTVIPSTSFSSYSTFESYWNYLYPWGSDHNGSEIPSMIFMLKVPVDDVSRRTNEGKFFGS
jgi:hypothetical protein